jgi:hypothetical protein
MVYILEASVTGNSHGKTGGPIAKGEHNDEGETGEHNDEGETGEHNGVTARNTYCTV